MVGAAASMIDNGGGRPSHPGVFSADSAISA
jgi:hypothetical protein